METPVAIWTREAWSESAAIDLADLIAGERERIMSELQAGTSHLYRVEGRDYDGRLMLRFTAESGCHVLAYRGRGVAGGLRDLAALCRGNGFRSLSCRPHSQAHQRLYRRIGFIGNQEKMEFAL